MSAELFKPSTADGDVTRLKLCLRQKQQARYYNKLLVAFQHWKLATS